MTTASHLEPSRQDGRGSWGSSSRVARVLVVDDSVVDRKLAGGLIEKLLGLDVTFASQGREALEVLKADPPNVILTDLQMPEMDGLELVETVRSDYPLVPVVVMTAHGSEEIAVQALKSGAASYVPKRLLATDLGPTLNQVLLAASINHDRRRVLGCLVQTEHHFCLHNDPQLIPPLVTLLQDKLILMNLCKENTRIRVGVALEEALCNALYHGNLEVSSELRQSGDQPYRALIEERRQKHPYQDRLVHVFTRMTRQEAIFVIRDEGPGFDPNSLPDPTDPANLERASGRGLLLIRTFMDQVKYNAAGNEITMVKRQDATGGGRK